MRACKLSPSWQVRSALFPANLPGTAFARQGHRQVPWPLHGTHECSLCAGSRAALGVALTCVSTAGALLLNAALHGRGLAWAVCMSHPQPFLPRARTPARMHALTRAFASTAMD